MRKQFGAKPSAKDIEKYSRSGQWNGDKFVNLQPTSMSINIQNLPRILYKQFFQKKGREPKEALAIKPFDKGSFLKSADEFKFIWYGHSVVLMRMSGKTILIDPMLGNNAAPISPFPVKRFSDDTLKLIDGFPEIDILLLSHDHYDHLDLDSIQKLKTKTKSFFVALGVARHLIKWGIPEHQITEFDWWEQLQKDGLQFTFTPTRHFSGRGLNDRAKSLWGGWAIKTKSDNIWFSGDSGYGKHFEEIGEKLGPFDFGFMESGQYNQNWHQIHMFPEESIQAAKDANVKKVMPVHWGAFALAQHHWQEPVERFVREAEKQNVDYITPELGELVNNSTIESTKWWKG